MVPGTSVLLAFESLWGGGHFEFLKSLVPHSVFLSLLFMLDFFEVIKPVGNQWH